MLSKCGLILASWCLLLVAACGESAESGGTLSCGSGTTQVGSECVAESGDTLSCGDGTTQQGQVCLGDVGCGAGTELANGVCLPTEGMTCGTNTVVNGNQCQVDLEAVCGTDTLASGATCIGLLQCGTDTTREGNTCAAYCGVGTTWTGSTCVADGSSYCGTGTSWSGSSCAVDCATYCADCSTSCGADTIWSGSECVVPPPSASFTAFTANDSLNTSFYDDNNSTQYNNLHQYTFIATDLSQGTADAWTEIQTPLVGAGSAVHLSWNHNTNYQVSTTPQTIPVKSASVNGNCLSTITPNSEPAANIDGTYVNFFAWSGASAEPEVCGRAGSVTFVRETSPTDRIKMTFNVEFSDGTTWVNKVFYASYRHN